MDGIDMRAGDFVLVFPNKEVFQTNIWDEVRKKYEEWECNNTHNNRIVAA